jgi:hypothetical protein
MRMGVTRGESPFKGRAPAIYTDYKKAMDAAERFLLSNEYKAIIDEYTGVDSFAINRLLRKSKTFEKAILDDKYGLAIEVLQGALEDAPSYRGTVYRGLRFEKRKEFDAFMRTVKEAADNDSPLLFKGFTSTTPDEMASYSFLGAPENHNVLIKIKSRSGVVIEGLSDVKSEREVLLGAHSKFKVVGLTSKKQPATGGTLWILELEELPKKVRLVELPEQLRLPGFAQAQTPTATLGREVIDSADLSDLRQLDDYEGGINASYKATWKAPDGSTKKVLYKPIKGETWIAQDMHPEWNTTRFLDEMGVAPSEEVRRSINNTSLSLAEREVMVREIYDELGLKYVDMPEVYPVYEGDELKGVAIGWMDDVVEDVAYTGRNLMEDEEMEFAIFDYLMGNTDRHGRNWMRHTTESGVYGRGRPVFIDHGYVIAEDLSEFRCDAVVAMKAGQDWDVDQDHFFGAVYRKLENFDVDELARRHPNMHEYEIQAMKSSQKELLYLMRNKQVSDFFEEWYTMGYSMDDHAGNWFAGKIDY